MFKRLTFHGATRRRRASDSATYKWSKPAGPFHPQNPDWDHIHKQLHAHPAILGQHAVAQPQWHNSDTWPERYPEAYHADTERHKGRTVVTGGHPYGIFGSDNANAGGPDQLTLNHDNNGGLTIHRGDYNWVPADGYQGPEPEFMPDGASFPNAFTPEGHLTPEAVNHIHSSWKKYSDDFKANDAFGNHYSEPDEDYEEDYDED
jgi:hypothetical protein